MPNLNLKGTRKEIIQQCEDILKDAEEKAEVCPTCHVKPKVFVNKKGEPDGFGCICSLKNLALDPALLHLIFEDLYYKDHMPW